MLIGRGPRARQRSRRRKWNLLAFLAPILLILGVPAWFLFPLRDSPVSSDAVVVIAGAADGRHQLGAQLVEEGISKNFVVSNPAGSRDKVGSAHCRGKDQPEGVTQTWCMRPTPITTVGEAMTMGRIAEEEGWATLTAVTNRPHTHRVRAVFKQCTNLDVVVVSTDYVNMTRMPYHVGREIGGYIKFWLTNPC